MERTIGKLLFGTGGVPVKVPQPRSSVAGIERIAALGLDCMEIEFVQGVKMSEQTALQVKLAAKARGVLLTAHGPYAINLNAADPLKLRASKERILQTARIGTVCGAESIVFHAGFYGGDEPRAAYDKVKEALIDVMTILRKEHISIWIRLELTGKNSEFGNLDELLRLSSEIQGLAPCIDFAHWHARTGRNNSYREFVDLLKQLEAVPGGSGLANMHMHVSGVQYGKHGEIKHLPLKESDFRYEELLKALKDLDASGFVVCESPNLEDDAQLLQASYHSAG